MLAPSYYNIPKGESTKHFYDSPDDSQDPSYKDNYEFFERVEFEQCISQYKDKCYLDIRTSKPFAELDKEQIIYRDLLADETLNEQLNIITSIANYDFENLKDSSLYKNSQTDCRFYQNFGYLCGALQKGTLSDQSYDRIDKVG